MNIPANARILFQGDSITDCNRKRNKPDDLGKGYASLIAVWFSAMTPEKRAIFINRGLSGNRAVDLRKRWQKDCINLKPDILTILVGVNDVLYHFWEKPHEASFEENYRKILEEAKAIPYLKIILMEPFMVQGKKSEVKTFEVLNSRINVTRKLAKEFNCALIPLNDIFLDATMKRESSYWSNDGVHPTAVGHALIAQSWINTVFSP